MIPKEYKGQWLAGEICRPLCPITNGYGVVVTPDTLCVIDNVKPGKGITIRTEICPNCGQYSCITRVAREKLQLTPESEERVAQKLKDFKKQQQLSAKEKKNGEAEHEVSG